MRKQSNYAKAISSAKKTGRRLTMLAWIRLRPAFFRMNECYLLFSHLIQKLHLAESEKLIAKNVFVEDEGLPGFRSRR